MKLIQVKVIARVSDDWMEKHAHELVSADGQMRMDIALRLTGEEETRAISVQPVKESKHV